MYDEQRGFDVANSSMRIFMFNVNFDQYILNISVLQREIYMRSRNTL